MKSIADSIQVHDAIPTFGNIREEAARLESLGQNYYASAIEVRASDGSKPFQVVEPMLDLPAGTSLAVVPEERYRITTKDIDRFGKQDGYVPGMFSGVLIVHDDKLDKEVAIKIFDGTASRHIYNSWREARITASLQHPNIPIVYDIVAFPLDDGRNMVGMVTEVLEPIPAELDLETSLRYIDQAASVIQYLREQNVEHFDVKPEHFMRVPGTDQLKLVDFGRALVGDDAPKDQRAALEMRRDHFAQLTHFERLGVVGLSTFAKQLLDRYPGISEKPEVKRLLEHAYRQRTFQREGDLKDWAKRMREAVEEK